MAQLEAIPSNPITCYLGEEADPHLATTSLQVEIWFVKIKNKKQTAITKMQKKHHDKTELCKLKILVFYECFHEKEPTPSAMLSAIPEGIPFRKSSQFSFGSFLYLFFPSSSVYLKPS